jgi:hypothetical protein
MAPDAAIRPIGEEAGLDQDRRDNGGVEHEAHGEVRPLLRRFDDVARHG